MASFVSIAAGKAIQAKTGYEAPAVSYEKRAIPLLHSVGFMRPAPLLRNGSAGSITCGGKAAKLESMLFSDVAQLDGKGGGVPGGCRPLARRTEAADWRIM